MQDPVEFFLKISPLENSHDLLWYMDDTNKLLFLQKYLKTNIQQGEAEKDIHIA